MGTSLPVPDVFFKSDHGYRRRLFTAYAAGLLCCCGAALLLLPPFFRYLRACDIIKFLTITELCAVSFLLCFIGPAVFLIYTGRKILLHKQVPYPGMKVIRDTKVIFGKRAVFRGKLLVAFGCVSIFIAIMGSIATHHFFYKLRHFNPFQTTVMLSRKNAGERIS